MGLLTLKTQFKSLKYSSDGQSSGISQPFITTPVGEEQYVTAAAPFGTTPFFKNGTGLIGSLINDAEIVVTRSGQDVLRLGKFFTTTPGLLFIGKQNVLSRTGVATQGSGKFLNEGPYLPTNTLAQVAGVSIGSHFFKQGYLPNGFGVPKYADAVTTDQDPINNRLYDLYFNKINNTGVVQSSNPRPIPVNTVSFNPNEILSYGGGPNSTLGVGLTIIGFADNGNQRTGINNILYTDIASRNKFYGILTVGSITTQPAQQLALQEVYKNQPVTKLVDFRARLRAGVGNSSILSKSPNYGNNEDFGPEANIETRVFLGNPGKRDKNIISYTAGLGTSLDKVNAKSLYSSRFVSQNEVNDLVKFRIEAINNDDPAEGVFMHFRAFIDSFNDNYSANWDSIQYIGRGEKFYNYDSFDRTINLSWTVVAQSKEELIPMYQKLNFLASNLMPDYNASGYMRGPLVRLTVGGYLYSQPGFITNLTYEVPQEATWEIGINDIGGSDNSVKELPHMIKVTGFTFTPIHNFVPRKQINTYGGTGVNTGRIDNENNPIYGDEVSSFGPERFIALSNGSNENYNNTTLPTQQPVPQQPAAPTSAEENQAAIDAITSLNQFQAGTSLRP